MTPVQRVDAVIAGRHPDRPPVSFWYHFPADQVAGPAAVRAHLDHLERFELDFLKVMNDNGYPHAEPVTGVRDLAAVGELRGDETEFARQLELIHDMRRELRGRVLMTTTIFNAWSELRHLVRPPAGHNPPVMDPEADWPSRRIRELLAEDEPAVRRAIEQIGRNLAAFARSCLEAGADGIFLSVRDDWVGDPQLYADLVRLTDLEILASAAEARFNVLHVCGRALDFEAFGRYPVQVINWADRSAGPPIAAASKTLRPAIGAGIDNLRTLPEGTPEDCAREAADALRQAGDRPLILAPTCTYDPQRVPEENLRAVCQAARAAAEPHAVHS